MEMSPKRLNNERRGTFSDFPPSRRRAFGTRRIFEARVGITVMETIRLRATEQLTATAMSRKSWPASSWTKITGRKTAMVVRVLARIAPHTSTVPLYAATRRASPICM